ncbi:MAG: 3-deoxy-manno-octulosonate cytidylyltransferase [Pseudomonadota bacterium]|nr:3-deoxy-manno-octulosonate cytidylyltransferase [Pseudomonadota bacterium]
MADKDAPSFALVIPARYESTRFPGKPLAELRGASGQAKPLIRRSWEAAVGAGPADHVWVATDDRRVADAVHQFGGQVVMTSEQCRNGTERCAEAIGRIPDCPDIIVNFQGDAPLTPAHLPGRLAALLADEPSAAMATPALRCSQSTYRHLEIDSAAGRVGGTTVVFNRHHEALYFSKRVLPYIPPETPSAADQVHLHLGLYAYRREALRQYAESPPSALELLEGLEQLRFLDQGQAVKVLPLDPVGWDCIELNNSSDIAPIEAILRQRGIE